MLDKIINIKAYWDDDNGNICFKNNNYPRKHKVTITGSNFKKWDALDKLDFFTDLENWMQSEINDIHDQIGEKNSFVYSYIMRCPKSTKQLLEEQKDPTYAKRMNDLANKIRLEADEERFGKKGNVIQFPRKESNNVR